MLLLYQAEDLIAFDASSRSTCSIDYWSLRPIDIRHKFRPFHVVDATDHRDFVRIVNRQIQSHFRDVTTRSDLNLIAETIVPLLRLMRAMCDGKKGREQKYKEKLKMWLRLILCLR